MLQLVLRAAVFSLLLSFSSRAVNGWVMDQQPFGVHELGRGRHAFGGHGQLVRQIVNDTVAQETFHVNVGDRTAIRYVAQVLDRHGAILCEEDLKPTAPPWIDPETILFSDSSYTHSIGWIKPYANTTSNPLEFVPWYGGTAKVAVTGGACRDYHPQDWVVEDILHANKAIVTPKMETSRCVTQPTILDGLLRWLNPDERRCAIDFRIKNGLSRKASFGGMQIALYVRLAIRIEDAYVDIINVVGPVLDGARGRVAHYGMTVASGDETVLPFRDAPGVSLGNGCWSSPTKRGSYDSVNLTLAFETFIMQDYDGVEGVQVPIGGDAVVHWTIVGVANLVEGAWAIDGSRSEVVKQPAIASQAKNFAPWYNDHVQSPDLQLADFDEATGCWEFRADPAD